MLIGALRPTAAARRSGGRLPGGTAASRAAARAAGDAAPISSRAPRPAPASCAARCYWAASSGTAAGLRLPAEKLPQKRRGSCKSWASSLPELRARCRRDARRRSARIACAWRRASRILPSRRASSRACQAARQARLNQGGDLPAGAGAWLLVCPKTDRAAAAMMSTYWTKHPAGDPRGRWSHPWEEL